MITVLTGRRFGFITTVDLDGDRLVETGRESRERVVARTAANGNLVSAPRFGPHKGTSPFNAREAGALS